MLGFSKLGKGKLDEAVTLIAAGTEITGDLRFGHQLYLNGRVTGNLSALEGAGATVVISESGSVTGDIRVPNVVISGRVEGNVYASGRVELAAKARVIGNVHYRLMEMQIGALVDGQLLHYEGEAGGAERTVAPEVAIPSLKPGPAAGRPSGA